MQISTNIRLILDTHVFIWLMNGENHLSEKAINSIKEATKDGAIVISAISLWEISMLNSKKRISLDQPCLTWIKRSLGAPGIVLYPLTPEVSVESSSLPGNFHGDSTDKIIVASARILGVPLVTRDQKIITYGKEDYVHCIMA